MLRRPQPDEELEHDDPEVEEASGDREASGAGEEDDEPVRTPEGAQGDHHPQNGGQTEANDQDHDVDQPGKHEPPTRKRLSHVYIQLYNFSSKGSKRCWK